MANQSLLEFILSLLRDPETAQAFDSNPQAVLNQQGFGDLCGDDVAEAMPLVADHSRVSFDRHYDGGGNVVHPSMPAPHPGHGESDIHAVIRQIQYVTSNYSYTDSHNSILDNSVNQAIWADGDVLQNFDNDPVMASGNGAVAAGDDVDGTITTGDDNVVGDDNEVSAGDGATSFGDGDANTGDVTAHGPGAAASANGHAEGGDDESTHTDVDNFGSGNVAVAGDDADIDADDSHDDNSSDSHDDSHDDSSTDSHDDSSTHDNTVVDDSNNSVHDNDVLSHNDVMSHNDVPTDNPVDTSVAVG
jgi:hypothetical protein